VRRTPRSAIELAKRLGAQRTNTELATDLNRVGLKTGTGRHFGAAAVSWMRYAYRIEPPRRLAPGELSVKQVAARLGVAPDAVYYWISQGQLAARRLAGGWLCVPFSPGVEQAVRQRIANSNRIKLQTQNAAVGGV
jgi:excisionase family DNA binding protein